MSPLNPLSVSPWPALAARSPAPFVLGETVWVLPSQFHRALGSEHGPLRSVNAAGAATASMVMSGSIPDRFPAKVEVPPAVLMVPLRMLPSCIRCMQLGSIAGRRRREIRS